MACTLLKIKCVDVEVVDEVPEKRGTSMAPSLAPTHELSIKVWQSQEAVGSEPTHKREAKQPPLSKRQKSNKPAKSVEILCDDTSDEEDVLGFRPKKT